MPELRVRQNRLQRVLQCIPASAVGAALFSWFLHHVDRHVMRLSKQRWSIPQLVVGLPTVMLTTTGARSGAPRTLPVIGVPDGENIALVASNWGGRHHPAWYFNLLKYPRATLQFDGHAGSYLAREVARGEQYDRLWRRAAALYGGFEKYRARCGGRVIPILLLEPV